MTTPDQGAARFGGAVSAEERDRQILALWNGGMTQTAIGERYGISQPAVSQILTRFKIARGPIDKAAEIERMADLLDEMTAHAMEVARQRPAPLVAGKDATYVTDPETGQVVYDHGGRLAALASARATLERKAKLLGLDSATKVETTGTVTYKIDGLDPGALT